VKAIYKYILRTVNGGKAYLTLPVGAKIISVETQKNDVVAYAIVDPSERTQQFFKFLVYGTGQPLDHEEDEYTFLGTAKMYNGEFMWHVFYKKERKFTDET
jgi:hypothetical protein